MVSLHMADRLIKYPQGFTKDILVTVDKLIFPTYFIVLDIEEDGDIPIILEIPFLAMSSALIDV